MKIQFQREDHNRQDKSRKPDYVEELRKRNAKGATWSGLGASMRAIRAAKRIRDLELQQAEQFYFVYGKWLYQNTRKLSHFASLNSKHTSLGDPAIQQAFRVCRRNWLADSRKIVTAIKQARIVRRKTLPSWRPSDRVVDWQLPPDIIADEVWRKIPPSFKSIPGKEKRLGNSDAQSQTASGLKGGLSIRDTADCQSALRRE
jgi:hypothetical protein